ncbi:hypothetical protein WJX84_009440 [Apatococcus fuscideae]|uniref:Glucuronosyltransferase n=1 Tax=Apatococcus fuscideae TaxID=2026836 RepID=A0AAW1RP78_9CHLO
MVCGHSAVDRENAGKTAVYHGFGVSVDPHFLTTGIKDPIEKAIKRVLQKPSFMMNAKKLQKRMQWTRHPAEKAADIVEKVMLTGAEDYLQTHYHRPSWWQHSLLDIYGLLALLLALFVMALILVAWSTYRMLRSALRLSTRLASRNNAVQANSNKQQS